MAADRILIVIPTYNERENLPLIVGRVHTALPDVHILVVDDGSPDGTAERVRWVMQRMDGVHLLERATKNGLGGAYRAGFAWGVDQGYDVLCEMDADGSHRPEDFPRLLAAVEDGADLVIGSRYVAGGEIPQWTFGRRMLSKGGNQYASLMLGLGVHDATGGFRAYRATLLRRIDFAHLCADGYGFQIEGTMRAVRSGARVLEVPIRFEDRAAGESKMSKAIVVEALTLVTKWGLAERASRVLRLFRRSPATQAGVNRSLAGAHSLTPGDTRDWAGASLAGSKRGH